jgi:hypothetical protein
LAAAVVEAAAISRLLYLEVQAAAAHHERKSSSNPATWAPQKPIAPAQPGLPELLEPALAAAMAARAAIPLLAAARWQFKQPMAEDSARAGRQQPIAVAVVGPVLPVPAAMALLRLAPLAQTAALPARTAAQMHPITLQPIAALAALAQGRRALAGQMVVVHYRAGQPVVGRAPEKPQRFMAVVERAAHRD